MPVVWYLYIFFICQLFVYLEAKMSTNWHFWRLLKMQTNSCIFVNKHHKNFLLGYFFIPYVYLNFDRKKNLEVHGMSRYLRHLQLSWAKTSYFWRVTHSQCLRSEKKLHFEKKNFHFLLVKCVIWQPPSLYVRG